mmetsp:Transcript_6780/g.16827  ORF Transcript_6780/g.16827 Transcript_6780/m.16827 type:complete len:94 (+) Transcript_6780:1019-1300(+)
MDTAGDIAAEITAAAAMIVGGAEVDQGMGTADRAAITVRNEIGKAIGTSAGINTTTEEIVGGVTATTTTTTTAGVNVAIGGDRLDLHVVVPLM